MIEDVSLDYLKYPNSAKTSTTTSDAQDTQKLIDQSCESVSRSPRGSEYQHEKAYVIGRRPSKKVRRVCSQIIECLLFAYQNDEVTLSNIAWSLASKHSYMRGLCLKHEIPWLGQDAAHAHICEMPQQIKTLWTQVCSGTERR